MITNQVLISVMYSFYTSIRIRPTLLEKWMRNMNIQFSKMEIQMALILIFKFSHEKRNTN